MVMAWLIGGVSLLYGTDQTSSSSPSTPLAFQCYDLALKLYNWELTGLNLRLSCLAWNILLYNTPAHNKLENLLVESPLFHYSLLEVVYIAERHPALLLPLPHSLLGSELYLYRFHSPGHCWYGSLIFRLATWVHPLVMVHFVHVTVDLHCSTVAAVDPVVAREMTKGWYNMVLCI